MFHRLMPLASIVDRFSQNRYMQLTSFLMEKSGVRVNGRPLWVSPRAYLDISSPGSITLNEGCVISHYASLLTHDFSMDRAAKNLHNDISEDMEYSRAAPIIIGENAFVGLSAIVLPGITIGSGAIIGAGAVVTKDVPDNSIVAGNPGRILGYTTDDLPGRLADYALGPRRR